MNMENIKAKNTESMEKANDPAIYKTIVIGLIFCMVGTFGRFLHDSFMVSLITWIILFIGTFICCKAVFQILNASKK